MGLRTSDDPPLCVSAGLTVAQSEDPEVLLVHLGHLKTRRDGLLDRKILCGPVEVQTQLTLDLQEDQLQRDRLRAQNQQLMTRYGNRVGSEHLRS